MKFIILISFILTFSSCSSKQEGGGSQCISSAGVIYGKDGIEALEQSPQSLQDISYSIAAFVKNSRVQDELSSVPRSINNYQSLQTGRKVIQTVPIHYISGKPFCDQSINDERSYSDCTGILVGKKHLLTAGHCLRAKNKRFAQIRCQSGKWIFESNSKRETSFGKFSVSNDDVYSCKNLLEFKNTDEMDYALIELDREVVGRSPVRFMNPKLLEKGDELASLGHMYGMHMKSSLDGEYFGISKSENIVRTKIDTFPGFSGGPVIDMRTMNVIGVHIAGLSKDLKFNVFQGCYEINKACRDADKCGESMAFNIYSVPELKKYINDVSSDYENSLQSLDACQ